MGYSIRREHVTHNLKLLEAIDEKLSLGETFTITPREGMSPSTIAYQIRNMLKSAETFDSYGFAHLASQSQVSTKSDRVEIAPKYGFAQQRVMSDMAAMEHLMQETKDFVTLTFHLSGELEDFAAALDDWKITSARENDEENTVTVSFERKQIKEDSPFSLLSAAESADYEEHLKRLLDEADE